MAHVELGGLIIEAERLLHEAQIVLRDNASEETLRICDRLRKTLILLQEQLDVSRDVEGRASTQASIARMHARIDHLFEQAKASFDVPPP